MFDHIGVVVSDFATSKAFYTQALAPIGHSRVVEIMLDGGVKQSAGFCHEDG
jgi:catechol 2,3-dioxygenase-like lactoylglutathione lyase family enzyme